MLFAKLEVIMRTIELQKSLLEKGHLHIDDSIELVRKNKVLDNIDKMDCIDVLQSGNFEKYCYLDTFVRDKLMDMLSKRFEVE